MKKLLSFLFAVVIISTCLLGITSLADDLSANNGEFTVATFPGLNSILKNSSRAGAIEEACYWLSDIKKDYNLKYVSFMGEIITNTPYKITDYNNAGKTYSQLQDDTRNNPVWIAEYKRLSMATKPLIEDEIPMGISVNVGAYISVGYDRESLLENYYPIDYYSYESTVFDFKDEHNYYYIVENNGVKYMIFQLELWPREATLDWFNETVAKNPDKYVIVFTPSFIDENGAMYTTWDWDQGFKVDPANTTHLHSYGMVIASKGKCRDGEALWKYAFSKHDNILAIISGFSKKSGDIKMSTFKNANGVEVAAIFANAEYSRNGGEPTLLFTKFSKDNKTITCGYRTAFGTTDQKSVQTVTLNKIGELKAPVATATVEKIKPQANGANKSYMLGTGDNTFSPNKTMTKAEACLVFARLLLETEVIPDGYKTRFTDVKEGSWYYNAVAYLDEKGFFSRLETTTYKPNDPITRAEFVDIAYQASALIEKNKVSFPDVTKDNFYYDSIMAAGASGLVLGFPDGTFGPEKTITRAEVVTIVNRLLGLVATERTVSIDRAEKIFADAKNHWARYNIVMATNSNVHGDYYYEASLDGVIETTKDYTFENKHVSITVSKSNGKVTKIINKYTGKDIATQQNTAFVFAQDKRGSNVNPIKLETVGNRIKVSFKNGFILYMLVDVNDNYMSFEIDSEFTPEVKGVRFANILTNLPNAVNDDDFMLNGMGMAAFVNPVNRGYRLNANSTIAQVDAMYENSGLMGAKLGVVFSKKADAIKYLQEVADAIDPAIGLTSKAAGPYAKEWDGNRGDYGVITNLTPSVAEKTIKYAKEAGMSQLDIHQGVYTFRQGDFHFYNTDNGTAKEFYNKYGKQIEDLGMVAGLHTYAYYIDYEASGILANPTWQKDLELQNDVYTLRKRMSKTTRSVATVEDVSSFDMTKIFFYKNSRYILIDEEIILVGVPTTEGFINCTRGQSGTIAANHAQGAKIYHLSGYFNMFVPKLGSDLFYHIADLTAKAYNEGGFNMLYLDAIDGLNRHLPDGHETWYYFQMFVHRIISQCERTPIVETSQTAPQEWNIRGRRGSWDTATRSYKNFIDQHINSNKMDMQNNMYTTLGWWNFYPDSNITTDIRNTIYKTQFKDDIDYLGTAALVYDMTIVLNPIEGYMFERYEPFKDNTSYYSKYYSTLRKSNYFSKELLETIKEKFEAGQEFRVIEKAPGEYAFLEMYYNNAKLGLTTDGNLMSFEGNNPYGAQTPAIRIEARMSTLFENEFKIADYDETKTVGEQMGVKRFSLNMYNSLAMKVRVKGTGVDGDALLFVLNEAAATGEETAVIDYFIDLNFTGWREFILLDADNADYDIYKYAFPNVWVVGGTLASYRGYRSKPDFSKMGAINVIPATTNSKSAQIGSVYAYKQTPAEIENPTLTIRNSKITFNCTMVGGDYIEFDPITKKAVLHYLETVVTDQETGTTTKVDTSKQITYSGNFEIPNGAFTCIYSAKQKTDAPLRARVQLGFAGQEYKD